MKLFECHVCSQALYFENTTCERCHHRLGYIAATQDLAAFEQDGNDPEAVWHVAGAPDSQYRFCDNARYDVCNWYSDMSVQYCSDR